ncbi:Tannase/feruloyl esterase [Xylariomycetidae sp. FL2044]|nr:Tannase/feruloyl esterase [Xylariomycetidae sp. FL2044]
MSRCVPETFAEPVISGAEILSLTAALVTNYSCEVTSTYYPNHPPINVEYVTFCNVTVSYTHPGDDDFITAEAWLPTDNWNGRLQATGGSGLGLGRFDISYGGMAGAIGEGYATISADGGITNPLDPYTWVLDSPGEINNVLIGHWGGDTLNDMAVVAKGFVQDFYDRPPAFSYFNGCSNGGRQGFEIAQRWPDAYDGIASAAPAIHWAQWAPAMFWPQMLMNVMGQYPRGCELDFLTSLAVQKCDGDDGVVDGIISNPKACFFDPFPYVGTRFPCAAEGRIVQLSEAAAVIANATWTGPTDVEGNFLWYGVNYGTDLSGDFTGTGMAAVNCNTGALCRNNPIPLAYQWIQLFVEKDPNYNYTAMNRTDFDEMMRKSAAELDQYVANSDPDLTEFYSAGGKMMTYHGLYDQIIPIQATEKYYNKVAAILPNIHDFYRFYEVPGLGHCFGNGQPSTVFDALRAWVENGTVSESLPTTLVDVVGKSNDRIICPYPERAVFDKECGDAARVQCFACAVD